MVIGILPGIPLYLQESMFRECNAILCAMGVQKSILQVQDTIPISWGFLNQDLLVHSKISECVFYGSETGANICRTMKIAFNQHLNTTSAGVSVLMPGGRISNLD